MPQVRLVGITGEPLGIVPIEQALRIAEESNADLVEVAPNATPPVCRVVDYRKLQYEQQRRQKEARKHQRQIEVKSVRLRPSIDPHDYQVKLNQLRAFLLKGFKVRVMIVFKGAQLRRYELGTELMDKLIADIKDIGFKEPGSRSQRRMITALISPTKEVEQAAIKQMAKNAKVDAHQPKGGKDKGGEKAASAAKPANPAEPAAVIEEVES